MIVEILRNLFSFYEKNWEKILSASKKFPKNLKNVFVFARRLLKVSVAALVKFALSRVKSVTFFLVFSLPNAHVEDLDLFGGFTDLVLFFQVSFSVLVAYTTQPTADDYKDTL